MYLNGTAQDYECTQTEWNDIKANACDLNIVTASQFTIGNTLFYKQVCSFYGSSAWAGILGSATMSYQSDNVMRGVFDTYDFDFKIRFKPNGNPNINATLKTAAAAFLPAPLFSANPFRLHYGVVDPATP